LSRCLRLVTSPPHPARGSVSTRDATSDSQAPDGISYDALTPLAYRQDVVPLANALQQAATMQYEAARQTLAKGVLVALSAAALAAALVGNGNS